MDHITVRELKGATSGKLICGDDNGSFTGLCTDSRIFEDGDMFVALAGENTDGHDYIEDVIKKGCGVLLVSEENAADRLKKLFEEMNCRAGKTESLDEKRTFSAVLVPDTLVALQAFTGWYLEKIAPGKIAVTGSVGKTSTRDMVYHILSEKYRTGKPIKNYNSDVGIPLTVAGFSGDTEMAVLEQGMEFPGEIHRLAAMTRPDVAIITNIGISHLENLGTRENIYRAKMEITDFFGENNVLIINESNDMLSKEKILEECAGKYNVISVGKTGAEDYVVSDIADRGVDGVEFTLAAGEKRQRFGVPIPGAHNAINAALAIAACDLYDVTWKQAASGLSKVELTGKRMKVRETGGIKILDDSYNAAPDSVKSAIRTMENSECTRRIAVLGAMNELGDDTPAYHREVGEFAADHGVDILIGIGRKAKDIVEGAKMYGIETLYFEKKEELYPELLKIVETGDLILTKASMTEHFWEIADKITELERE